jgi:hypothetical protein
MDVNNHNNINIIIPPQIISPKSKWKIVSHKVQDVSHWKHNETTTQCYTAKASFRILLNNEKIESRGECINIDQRETLIKKISNEKISQICLKISHSKYKFFICILNILKCILSLFILTGYIDTKYSIIIGIIWLFIPIHVFLISNRLILKRMWGKSFLPWIQLYIAMGETLALCSLCNWDIRMWIIGPPLLLSQITIINYDAVYFKPKDKKYVIIYVLSSLMWKILLFGGVRLNFFTNLNVHEIVLLQTKPHNVYLNNISLYASKTSSMIVFLCGQLYFRFKHRDKAYAIRTNYTIRSNKEWMELNRNNRIQKKKSLVENVKTTKKILKSTKI